MAKQKLGMAIFVGLIGATAVASSGSIFNANEFLQRFKKSPDEITIPVAEKPEPEKLEEATSTTSDVVPAKAEETPDVAAPVQEENVAQPSLKQSAETPVEAVKAPDTTNQDVVEKSKELAIAVPPTIELPNSAPILPKLPDPPTFDVLRVEPNGSMVVAGVASPNSDMELIAGTQILSEFVAILDEPLKPGDYQIVLRATNADGEVVTSIETAIVAIPPSGGKNVIALVETPGAPSRLISIPPVETALVPVDDTSALQADEANEKTDIEAPQEEETQEQLSSEAATVENEIDKQKTEEPVTPKQVVKPVPIRIEAVEIDGSKVFVAGSAAVGSKLRIYANEILLGDTTTNEQGRFLVDVNRDLPVGDYIIRADALSSNGAEVISRAAVPFTRKEGEKIAAVAVPKPNALPSSPPEIIADDASASEIEKTEDKPLAEPNQEVAKASTNLEERLTPVENSVVIRRGDTLWQISRRVYGRGVKYTTIYQANEEQISDPDKIWPGQFVLMLVPYAFKWATDALNGELTIAPDSWIPALFLGPIMLVVAYNVFRIVNVGLQQLRDALFASVGQHAVRQLAYKTFVVCHASLSAGTKGIESIVRFTILNTAPTIIEFALIAIIFGVAYGWEYVAVTTIMVCAYSWFTIRASDWRIQIRRDMNNSDTEANSKAVDSLLNFETVKYFGNEDMEARRFDKSMEGYEHSATRVWTSLGWLNFGQGIIFGIGLLIMMWMSASAVIAGKQTLGDFVFINAMLMQLSIPLNFIGFIYREIRTRLDRH
ncbi:Iron-sulfur clusters transporter ATM1, mitochondrial [Nymphon striatum]|nr:Iron-sulfur clusters transporter ATM1, mitochondrial [Nymphon striatum]